MRLVVIESPCAATTLVDMMNHREYVRAAVLDCLKRGEAPFASHALYAGVGVLDDTVPAERAIGIAAGCAWGDKADATVVYDDLGVSPGMKYGIDRAVKAGRPVEYRQLPGWKR